MSRYITEDDLESATLTWLTELGYDVLYGPDIAPTEDGEPGRERTTYSDVILTDRLLSALQKINPEIETGVLLDVMNKLKRAEFPSLIANNHAFHKMLINGVDVQYRNEEGRIVHDQAKLIDWNPDNIEKNDWLVVNQFTVEEDKRNRRPDVVVFVNGIPLGVIELKNPADEKATIWSAHNQLETYKSDIESLFLYNEVLVISDGLEARVGSLTAGKEWFMPWRTIEGEELAPASMLKLEVLIKGMFDKERFLDYLRYFIVFESDGEALIKKIAGYHQYHAVNNAIKSTIMATSSGGDQRAGVVWHTQGSGKSLTMAFYSGKVIQDKAMENPTLVLITDRNDLDGQLFDTFSRCNELLRQKPIQVENRAILRENLKRSSGGVFFTTIQKFFPEEKGDDYPELSDRSNIVVIADEAHRSQYGFKGKVNQKTGEIEYGFAKYLRDAIPNASFIGFTGTPIETQDKVTTAVFGNYISVYDIQRAVDDEATVPIYYEARLARLELSVEERPKIDPDFEELTEDQEEVDKTQLKRKWAAMEKIVGADKRIGLVAKDIVQHYEKRQKAIEGKVMIVCMSRRICVKLYDALVKLKPKWHGEEDKEGTLKIVMSGSASSEKEWKIHIRTKGQREKLANRFKDPNDHFKIVIVRDMWLTGFDAPSLHTMYVDKPMHSHTLMQAIARVNRKYKNKPGGLVVDYLGIADDLKRAMRTYTQSGGKGNTAVDQEVAVAVMLEKYEVCCGLFHGFDWSNWTSSDPMDRLRLLPAAQEHILQQEDGKKRILRNVIDLSKAFALSVPHEETERIRDDVAFFQAVRSAIFKSTGGDPKTDFEREAAIKQIVSRAVVSDEIIDVFAAAGLKRPDISILSESFLEEVKKLPYRNLAVETLRKLLDEEIKERTRGNLIQSKKFSKMLEESINKYKKRAITSAEAIMLLVGLAEEMREANKRGEKLNLTDGELAFYDALEVNDSAVKILGDEVLREIAIELVDTIQDNIAIDWTVKESVKAKLRVMIKRVLRKHGYPPDKQEKATLTVLEQAELLAQDWTEV